MKKEVQLIFLKSHNHIVDIFTKPHKFEDLSRLKMLVRVTNQI